MRLLNSVRYLESLSYNPDFFRYVAPLTRREVITVTSSVKVTAHCGSNKQVEVKLNGQIAEVLEDGESIEFNIYDDREVSAREVTKPE